MPEIGRYTLNDHRTQITLLSICIVVGAALASLFAAKAAPAISPYIQVI
jgi:hypothetical protein